MKELLAELRNEAEQLGTKSIGPIGFDYRRRTKIERLLFLIAKDICKTKFDYELGGISYSHQKLFDSHIKDHSCDPNIIALIKEAFSISDLVSELSSSDPYAREDAISVLGGTVHSLFENLSKKIITFAAFVEKL
ncbi:MAG: hypothetical protein ABR913_00700 [Sedimentisphaerales bacterium]|jgi:hypothetical protein